MTSPEQAPHFTREWLIDALRYVRRDFDATFSGEARDDRALARLETARRLGLGEIARTVIDSIDRAVVEATDLEWPGGLEIRYVALLGALGRLAGASSALNPHTDRHPHLTYLAEAMGYAELAAGSGYRSRAAAGFRGLYVIVDPNLTKGRDIRWLVQQAVEGGATAIQLRIKDADKGDWLHSAMEIGDLCRSEQVTFVINDHPDVAMAVGAQGVHLGQHDLPLATVRTIMKPWQLVGTSNALVSEARSSLEGGADYVAVGRMFQTESKSDTRPAGMQTLRAVRELVPVGGPPLVAIGGITAQNVQQTVQAGADCVCVIASVTQADQPKEAAARILDAFNRAQYLTN